MDHSRGNPCWGLHMFFRSVKKPWCQEQDSHGFHVYLTAIESPWSIDISRRFIINGKFIYEWTECGARVESTQCYAPSQFWGVQSKWLRWPKAIFIRFPSLCDISRGYFWSESVAPKSSTSPDPHLDLLCNPALWINLNDSQPGQEVNGVAIPIPSATWLYIIDEHVYVYIYILYSYSI